VRLGIFGGSFDPPHLGHLLPVIDATEALGLDTVRFIPAGDQPLKAGRASASGLHRLAMTERLTDHTVILPVYHQLTVDEQSRVIQSILQAAGDL